MVGIILASHGEFAKGIMQSGSMVFGDQSDVAAVTLMPSDGPEDFRKRLEDAVSTFSDQENVLFLADLWGGTPFNQSSAYASEHPSWAIVTGLNLPMLIEAYTLRMSDTTAREMASQIFTEGRNGVRILPEDLEPKKSSEVATVPEVAPSAPVQKPQVKDVELSDEPQMKITHVRIDSRLLHGQVATNWAKNVGCNRIIVVSDAVAHDELRKSLITQAAPPGIKANVTTIDQFVKCYHDPRFTSVKALVLFENPEDALAVQNQDVALGHINIGSLAHSVGKVMLNDAIAVGADDVAALLKLRDAGITFDTKKVPASGSDDIFALIEKNNMMP